MLQGYILPHSYTVRTAALAIGADTKWVDNVLSHHVVAGVEQGTRGVERRLNDDALIALALCRILCKQLGVPTSTAVGIANEIVADRSLAQATYSAAPGVAIQFSLSEIERSVRDRLGDASEATAHVRRGRPSRRSHTDD